MQNKSPRRCEDAQSAPSPAASIVVGSGLRSRRLHLATVAFAFVLFAIYGSWVPLNFHAIELSVAVERFESIRFLELRKISRADWVTNMLLFIPIGFFGAAVLTVDRGRLTAMVAVIPVALVSTGLSIAIEFSQFWLPGRTVSQNDIMAETLGASD